jgi:ABC-type multidrug transport system ATPase subunit
VTPLLQAEGLRKSYGSRSVLNGVELVLEQKEAVGLIGPNGAGKTTLLRIVMGLIGPTAGLVTWRGDPPGSAFARTPVGYFGGEQTIPPHVRSDRWSRAVAPHAEISQEARPVRTLSRGSRQILGLRTTLAGEDWAAVLLDEPWEGLDPDAARWLSERVRELVARGISFLLSSHRLHDLAGLCDRYAFLIDGRLVIRSAAEVASQQFVSGNDLLAAFDELRHAK